ncbi:MAG: hypothetical protein WCX93_06220 [Burkholderiaceae bacterium]
MDALVQAVPGLVTPLRTGRSTFTVASLGMPVDRVVLQADPISSLLIITRVWTINVAIA